MGKGGRFAFKHFPIRSRTSGEFSLYIPAACSALINPIMELRAKHIAKKKKKCEICSSDISNTKLDIKENVVNDKVQVVPFMQVESTAPITKTYNSFLPINYNSSLTIGGGK